MSEEAATEALHFRIGGWHVAFTGQNRLKAAFGHSLALLGRFPPITYHGEHIAPKSLNLEGVGVPLARDFPTLTGLRIGFITDIHHEPHRPVVLLERAVALLNAAAPDLILLGGDYVNTTARDFDRPLALLAQLRAPLGVFGVMGNHDYWGGADYLAARLTGAGVTILRNESQALPAPGGGEWWLIGVDSTVRGHDDLDAAFAGVPTDAFRLLLAHEPEVADRIVTRDFTADLQLSGHSHGGQFVLPVLGAPLLPRLGRRYVRGLHIEPTVYTSRGVGTVPPYLRLNSDPEVTLLTLIHPICGPPATP